MSALDSDKPDFMGPGRILEDDCNALEPDFMPRAADVQMPLTRAGHIYNLNVTVVCQNSGDLSSGYWTFFVDKEGTETSVTCAAKTLSGSAAPFIASCQDTTDIVAFNPNDQLSIEAVPTSTPNDDSCVVGSAVVEFGP